QDVAVRLYRIKVKKGYYPLFKNVKVIFPFFLKNKKIRGIIMDKLPLPLTALYAGFMGIVLVLTSIRVTVLRYRYKVDLGSGGNMSLLQSIRAHGNFSEHVPMALFLMAVAEVNGALPWIIHLFGLILIISRILHMHGVYRTPGPS